MKFLWTTELSDQMISKSENKVYCIKFVQNNMGIAEFCDVLDFLLYYELK